MSAPGVPNDWLRAGRDALARSAWPEGRAAFEEAARGDADPEALEGLAMAAFFLNDSEATLVSREQAYAAYRRIGRPVDAARVATALAWDYRSVRGEPAVSDGWLARARRLLAGTGPSLERGWLALREASFSVPRDTRGARDRCAEAAALGRELGDTDLEMTALALEGLVLVSCGEIGAGMALLDEATAAVTAGEMQDPMAIGFSCCYLIFACERVRDFDRAGQWCERLGRMAADWNIRSLLSVCRTHYGTVLVLRGEWARAETELMEAAAGLAPRSGEAAGAIARLAELRRRQGRLDEAAALVASVEHHPLAALCQGAIALERGAAGEAGDCASRYLRLTGEAGIERAHGLELLVEARLLAGDAEAAAAAAVELAQIAETAGTDPMVGAARRAEGLTRAAAGDRETARDALDDAVQLLSRAGLPFEAARARIDLARVLRAAGRRDDAFREATRAVQLFAELGAAGEERLARALLTARDRGDLTSREREVLQLVAAGRTNAEIAAHLVLSEHTVHRHVANILAKLGASSRAAAAARAAADGLI